MHRTVLTEYPHALETAKVPSNCGAACVDWPVRMLYLFKKANHPVVPPSSSFLIPETELSMLEEVGWPLLALLRSSDSAVLSLPSF